MYSIKSHHSFNKLNVSSQPPNTVSLWCPHLRKCISHPRSSSRQKPRNNPQFLSSLISLSPSQRQNLPPEYFFKYPSSLPPSTLEVFFPWIETGNRYHALPTLPSFPPCPTFPHPLLIYLWKRQKSDCAISILTIPCGLVWTWGQVFFIDYPLMCP